MEKNLVCLLHLFVLNVSRIKKFWYTNIFSNKKYSFESKLINVKKCFYLKCAFLKYLRTFYHMKNYHYCRLPFEFIVSNFLKFNQNHLLFNPFKWLHPPWKSIYSDNIGLCYSLSLINSKVNCIHCYLKDFCILLIFYILFVD